MKNDTLNKLNRKLVKKFKLFFNSFINENYIVYGPLIIYENLNTELVMYKDFKYFRLPVDVVLF